VLEKRLYRKFYNSILLKVFSRTGNRESQKKCNICAGDYVTSRKERTKKEIIKKEGLDIKNAPHVLCT
jgi:hypothetical protein